VVIFVSRDTECTQQLCCPNLPNQALQPTPKSSAAVPYRGEGKPCSHSVGYHHPMLTNWGEETVHVAMQDAPHAAACFHAAILVAKSGLFAVSLPPG